MVRAETRAISVHGARYSEMVLQLLSMGTAPSGVTRYVITRSRHETIYFSQCSFSPLVHRSLNSLSSAPATRLVASSRYVALRKIKFPQNWPRLSDQTREARFDIRQTRPSARAFSPDNARQRLSKRVFAISARLFPTVQASPTIRSGLSTCSATSVPLR